MKKPKNIDWNMDPLTKAVGKIKLNVTDASVEHDHYLYGKKKAYTKTERKKRMVEIIKEQPDDSSYAEILRELAFERMVERGLADSDAGRIISNQEMGRRIRTWQK